MAHRCPSCDQPCAKLLNFQKHILKCCPDLVDVKEWRMRLSEQNVGPIIEAAREKEMKQREQALDIVFRTRDADGNPLRQGPTEVAAALNLSQARAERLLKIAMRSIPLAADPIPVEAIYEDDDLLAVSKPPGVSTAPKHRYTGGSLVNRIIGTRGFNPYVLHRLDMNTTGVVLFGKKGDIVPTIHAEFREKTAHKVYLALVAGIPDWKETTVDAAIDRSEIEQCARKTVAEGGQEASTKFKILATVPGADLSQGAPAYLAAEGVAQLTRGAALVRCEPLTGRTHQIRVHLAHAGHPIIGDDLYGVNGPWMARQALHAAALTLTHPRSGEQLRVTAPLPEDFASALTALGFEKTDYSDELFDAENDS